VGRSGRPKNSQQRYRPLPTSEQQQTLEGCKGSHAPMSWHSTAGFDPPSKGLLLSPQQSETASPSFSDLPSGRKRKRTSLDPNHDDVDQVATGGREDENNADGRTSSSAGLANSPDHNSNGKPRHQPGVKRACNDCRQQKVRNCSSNEASDHPADDGNSSVAM
jgi:hypothetical protein